MFPPTEVSGDSMFKLAKFLPMQSAISSMLFNSEILKALALFRHNNPLGAGEPIETDEMHEMNSKADVRAILIHIVIFWFILIAVIEWRVFSVCCLRFKKINDTDNKSLLKLNNNFVDAGDSSEVGEIIEVGKDLEVRFHAR